MPRDAYKWLADNYARLLPSAWNPISDTLAEARKPKNGLIRSYEVEFSTMNGRQVHFKAFVTRNYRAMPPQPTMRAVILEGEGEGVVNAAGAVLDFLFDPARVDVRPAPTDGPPSRGHGYHITLEFRRGFVFRGSVWTDKLNGLVFDVNKDQPFCLWTEAGANPERKPMIPAKVGRFV